MRAPTHNKSTNIKDIALKCGVSAMTVSRALRGTEGVSEVKRQEILATAEELNYVLNSNARSLVKSSSDLVGISFPTLFNDVFADMLEGMRKTFENAGISTVVNTTNYDEATEAKWVSQLLAWRPAGIVLTGVDHAPTLRRKIRATGIPTIEIWDIRDDPIDLCVGVDHYNSGMQLGHYAVNMGYRRPGYVCSPTGLDQRADRRLAGIEQAFHLSENTEPLRKSTEKNRNTFLGGYEGTMALCKAEQRPDVIFYVNDHFAFGGYSACQELGLSVPDDIGLVGFNGLDINEVIKPRLTTAITPRRRIGEVAAGKLLARLNGIDVPPVTTLPVILEVGETTCQQ